MPTDLEQLGQLALWREWQDRVRNALPNFAAPDIYCSQLGITQAEWERVTDLAKLGGIVDSGGARRDMEFGALMAVVPNFGLVNRMWLDGQIEVQFLRTHLGLDNRRVLDIGAGYGRLAAIMWKYVESYTCVDAVPISTEICRQYCLRFAPEVEVLTLAQFKEQALVRHFDLAMNLHSFNECPYEEVERWLNVLRMMAVPWLFTVTHGTPGHDGWYTWEKDRRSFLPLIERDFDLVAGEARGLYGHPQYLWRRHAKP